MTHNVPTQKAQADDALALLHRHGAAATQYLRSVIGRYAHAPPRLMEAVEYSALAGGKRLRPALVLETFFACGGGAEPNRSALAAAGAVELIHTFSLVHDDLPAMDDDDLRRGRPTNHKVFGEAMAILAGDAMVAMAFEVLAADVEATLAPALVSELARATGPHGMIGGQVLDMQGEGQTLDLEQLRALHAAKTGALITASCRMGAVAAESGTELLGRVTEYGRALGLAFQIVDDLLDRTSTPEQLGKGTAKDAGRGKNTFPGLLGLEQSRAEARRQVSLAATAVAPLGTQSTGLRMLAEFVVDRQA
jgi:geranylgeranyl diphosphate synthase type II